MKRIVITVVMMAIALLSFSAGKQHVLNDSKIDVVGHEVIIEIDGELYVHNID